MLAKVDRAAIAAFFSLAAVLTVSAIETRPFSVRKFKTRDIVFRSGGGHHKNEDVERRRQSRDTGDSSDAKSGGAQAASRAAEAKDAEERILRQLEENESRQRELATKREEAEALEEWRQYLQRLRQKNEELKSEIARAEEERVRSDLCGAQLPDGSRCKATALSGKWYCAQHEDPPLPVEESVFDGVANSLSASEIPETPAEPRAREDLKRRPVKREVDRREPKEIREEPLNAPMRYLPLAFVILSFCVIFLFAKLLFGISRTSGDRARYGRRVRVGDGSKK